MFGHLYVHVPFCVSKCPYCDFCSVDDRDDTGAFLDALEAEMDLVVGLHGALDAVETVYVGGGTPTCLPLGDIKRLMRIVGARVACSPGVEWTVEANPESATSEKLACLHAGGATRISLGVQSFVARDLEALGRCHTVEQALDAIGRIGSLGFRSWSVDLMFGLAGQDTDGWLGTLRAAIDRAPPHISAYCLAVEPGTTFGKSPGSHTGSDEMGAEHFRLAMESLEAAGYEHYEVSNYAVTSHRSRHNEAYWTHKPYVGVGPSAHSFDGRRRWWNTTSVRDYLAHLAPPNGMPSGSPVVADDVVGPAKLLRETVMLRMRRAEGLAWTDIPANMVPGVRERLGALSGSGLLTIDDAGVRVAPDGWPVIDELVRRVLAAVEDPAADGCADTPSTGNRSGPQSSGFS